MVTPGLLWKLGNFLPCFLTAFPRCKSFTVKVYYLMGIFFVRSEKMSHLKCLSREDDSFVVIILCINKRRLELQKNTSLAYVNISSMNRSVFWLSYSSTQNTTGKKVYLYVPNTSYLYFKITFGIAYGGRGTHVRGSRGETSGVCLDSYNSSAPFLIVGSQSFSPPWSFSPP